MKLLILALAIIFMDNSCISNDKVSNAMEILLKETTVTFVGDEKVGCANIRKDGYILPNGIHKEGLTVQLVYLSTEKRERVGEGSEIQIQDKTFRVKEIGKRYKGKSFGYVIIISQDNKE